MIYGAVAASELRITVPDIAYDTSAVHFDGSAYLSRGAALTDWGSPSKFTAAIWTKLSAANDGIFSDANNFTQGTTADGALKYINFNVAGTYVDSFALAQIISGSWQCILASMDLTNCPSSAELRLYVGDSSVLEPDNTTLGSSTFAVGSDFWFGQDGFGVKITGDVADFRLWVGEYVDFNLEYKRRLFIRENGKPASPSLANASLGTPIISFIAESADPVGTFIVNGGSGGPFTLTGSLTGATTSPTTGVDATIRFAGNSQMTAAASIISHLLSGTAALTGSGQMTTDTSITNPLWQGSASFAGAGNLAAPAFIRFPPNVADWEFDENTGTTLSDSVDSNDGTLVNTPSWVAGKTGYALSFNGSTQCVTVGTFDPIPNGTTGTVSVWVKPSDFTNGVNHYVIAKGDDITVNSWGLIVIGNGTAAAVYIMYMPTLIAAHYTDAVIPNDGNFHHIVAIYGATADRKIYVDNVDRSLSTTGSPPSTHISNSALNLNIAKTSRADPYGYFYAGAIDNLKIFNRALTAVEVSDLYNLP